MSKYRRFVAYVYEYRKHKKGNNRGFVKVENKNGVCEFQINLRCPGLVGQLPCRIYGFVRQMGKIEGILIGETFTQPDGLQCEIRVRDGQMGSSQRELEDFGGMILLVEGGGFYGTEWDDRGIVPSQFEEEPLLQEERIAAAGVDQQEGEVGDQILGDADISEKEQEDGGALADQPEKESWEMKRESSVGAEEPEEDEAGQMRASLSQSEQSQEEDGECAADIPTQASQREDLCEETEQAEPSDGEDGESGQIPQNSSEQTEVDQAQMEQIQDESPDQTEFVPVQEMRQEQEGTVQEEADQFSQVEGDGEIQSQIDREKEGTDSSGRVDISPRQEAEPVFRKIPEPDDWEKDEVTVTGVQQEAFEPFGDGEIVECRKIEPRQFSMLNRRDWALRNNRFLIYGYYHFGHLLVGRIRGRKQYILGVPGMYDQQERFMANMFGFPNFKASHLVELPNGKGGYWYRLINPPNFNKGNRPR